MKSALPQTTDMTERLIDVRYAPIAEVPAQKGGHGIGHGNGQYWFGFKGQRVCFFRLLAVTVAGILLLGCGLFALVII
jgi:hypothetical protein